MNERKLQIEYGDFQTPTALAEEVCRLLQRSIATPRTIIEPTCGVGNFILGAAKTFDHCSQLYGFDINSAYIVEAESHFRTCYPSVRATFATQDFFSFDWSTFFHDIEYPLLVLGNPPWVTNAGLGTLGALNLPEKTNLKGLSGITARTGKSNFDISEWMLLKLADAAKGRPFTIAVLCKTSVARKALEYFWKNGPCPIESAIYRINAMKWFDVSVDACLFLANFAPESRGKASTKLYASLDSDAPSSQFGIVNGAMVSDVNEYQQLQHLSGINYYKWRSGIKHDLAKVMEFTNVAGELRNGFNECIELEDTHIYPLLKATDLSKGKTIPTKFALVTQNFIGEDTTLLRESAPKTWAYLEKYDSLFRERKSSIYNKQPKYCLFGIGSYTFAPFKIAISGLHKDIRFTLVPPFQGKPVVLDDTCYFVGSDKSDEAVLLHELFDADVTRRFLKATIFVDSKRPITSEVLNRIDIKKIAEHLGKEYSLVPYLRQGNVESNGQGTLAFEKTGTYS